MAGWHKWYVYALHRMGKCNTCMLGALSGSAAALVLLQWPMLGNLGGPETESRTDTGHLAPR